jgi:hypothetical protein
MKRQFFLNLPVRHLEQTKAFFAKLGFELDPKFTDDKAACLIIEPGGSFVMLLAEPFFQGFTPRQICNTATHLEALIGFSCASRAEVDAVHARALAAGGTNAGEPQDHGFMYGRSFYDLDGHHWEAIWMDAAAAN